MFSQAALRIAKGIQTMFIKSGQDQPLSHAMVKGQFWTQKCQQVSTKLGKNSRWQSELIINQIINHGIFRYPIFRHYVAMSSRHIQTKFAWMQEIPADLKDIARGSVSAEWGRLDLQETQTQTI